MADAAEPYAYRRDDSVPAFADDQPLIVYDGVCVLCSAFVRFVVRHDRGRRYRFADAGGPLGAALYRHFGLRTEAWDTFILVEQGRAWLRSDAGLRIMGGLGAPWSAARCLGVIPRSWRDGAYDLVARHRYRWFGRRDVCFRPDPGVAERFLT